jgi:hypothetical protein
MQEIRRKSQFKLSENNKINIQGKQVLYPKALAEKVRRNCIPSESLQRSKMFWSLLRALHAWSVL